MNNYLITNSSTSKSPQFNTLLSNYSTVIIPFIISLFGLLVFLNLSPLF